MTVHTAIAAEATKRLQDQEPSGTAWNWTMYVAGVLAICAIAFWIWREARDVDDAAAEQPRTWVAMGHHHRYLMYRHAQPVIAAITLLLAVAAISLATQDLGGGYGHLWAGAMTGGAVVGAAAVVIARRRADHHHTALHAELDDPDDPAWAAEFRALITDPERDDAFKHRRDALTLIIVGLSIGLLVIAIAS